MGKHEARRRHMQFIGKLMREVDLEPSALRLTAGENGTRANKTAFKASERWRERLIAEPDALNEFIAAQPDVDRDALAALVTKARVPCPGVKHRRRPAGVPCWSTGR